MTDKFNNRAHTAAIFNISKAYNTVWSTGMIEIIHSQKTGINYTPSVFLIKTPWLVGANYLSIYLEKKTLTWKMHIKAVYYKESSAPLSYRGFN